MSCPIWFSFALKLAESCSNRDTWPNRLNLKEASWSTMSHLASRTEHFVSLSKLRADSWWLSYFLAKTGHDSASDHRPWLSCPWCRPPQSSSSLPCSEILWLCWSLWALASKPRLASSLAPSRWLLDLVFCQTECWRQTLQSAYLQSLALLKAFLPLKRVDSVTNLNMVSKVWSSVTNNMLKSKVTYLLGVMLHL